MFFSLINFLNLHILDPLSSQGLPLERQLWQHRFWSEMMILCRSKHTPWKTRNIGTFLQQGIHPGRLTAGTYSHHP